MQKLIILTLVYFSHAFAWAIPEAPFDALKVIPSHKNQAPKNTKYNFSGIVKLSNCSGALVILSGMPLAAKALVMTNGHCVQKPGGYLQPGEVWSERPISRSMRLFDSEMKLHPLTSTKISYATMTSTDLAFYELDQTYADILSETGVEPLLIDNVRSFPGQKIEIISGYWDRGYSCAIDDFVFMIREGVWSWLDSIRYTSTCDTIGGTSGSPLIAQGERRIVGINNTSNRNGEACSLNNPCEVNPQGEIYTQMGLRYGQQIYQVYTCLTPDFRIDLEIASCELPK